MKAIKARENDQADDSKDFAKLAKLKRKVEKQDVKN